MRQFKSKPKILLVSWLPPKSPSLLGYRTLGFPEASLQRKLPEQVRKKGMAGPLLPPVVHYCHRIDVAIAQAGIGSE